MAITYRTSGPWGGGSGANLSASQVDNNFWTLVQDIQDLQAGLSGGAVVSISSFSVVGNSLYVTLTDSSVMGPYALPVAEWNFRGGWEPATAYFVQDVFDENGSLYLVLIDHTSAGSFDPHATDGSGHDLYGLLLTAPGSVLPTGGSAGQVLKKLSATDFDIDWADEHLSDLTDVALTSPLDSGDYLKFDGTHWVNSELSVTFAMITDIALGTPVSGDLLSYNGSHWTNVARSTLALTPAQTRFSATALGTTGTVSLDPTLGDLFTITSPTGDITLNAASAPAGAMIVVKGITSGTTSYAITFNTNFLARGNLITGKVAGTTFAVSFVGDGTNFVEVGRNGYLKENVLGTSGTVSLDPTLSEIFTVTPTNNITLNAASAPVGKRVTVVVTTSGTSSFNITPTTNFKSTGALATGTVTAKVFSISFIGDGTNLVETARTTAM